MIASAANGGGTNITVAFAGRHSADDLCAVSRAGFGMEGAFAAGQTLHD
jgi:hypothetical protein